MVKKIVNGSRIPLKNHLPLIGTPLHGGGDIFDQLASVYRLLRRSRQFTKIIFYDMLGNAVINSSKFMAPWMAKYPELRHFLHCQFGRTLFSGLLNLVSIILRRFQRGGTKLLITVICM